MIEVDYMPIGEETNTGDAILMRLSEPDSGIVRVVLIDGGFKETSAVIADHVRTLYGRDTIDLMVCTHPDDDHINGLFGVFDELEVLNLLIHRPSSHGYTSDDVKASKVDELVARAVAAGTVVHSDVFAGLSFFNGAVFVAGPTRAFYEEQLSAQTSINALAAALVHQLSRVTAAAKALMKSVSGDPGEGHLSDHGGTTARNNSSIILDVQVEGQRALFTGDAGVPALNAAADTLDAYGRSVHYPSFFDMPHHGSRHNLDSETANRLLGPIGGSNRGRAYVSVGKKAIEHPRPDVANALKRRGYPVYVTRGQKIWWHHNAPARFGWVPLEELDWLEQE